MRRERILEKGDYVVSVLNKKMLGKVCEINKKINPLEPSYKIKWITEIGEESLPKDFYWSRKSLLEYKGDY